MALKDINFKVYDIEISLNKNLDIVLAQNVGTISQGKIIISRDQTTLLTQHLKTVSNTFISDELLKELEGD